MLLSTDYTCSLLFIVLSCTINIKSIHSSGCSRIPERHGEKTPADGRFHIRILENTDKYKPGDRYTIKLEGIDAGLRSIPHRHTFSGFILAVEKSSTEPGVMDSSLGTFSLSEGDTLTKIICVNMVTHTTTITRKSEIQVVWTAPARGSGCVAFKATVIEHREIWYMDEGPLTKEFCEEEQSEDDYQNLPNPCCACSEAKYELTFEGLWSRNTHPKDFPSNHYITKFSDIIGASHTIEYWFWRYGEKATDGLQQVAEHGVTRELESELKAQSRHIRTIIKAKGLAYPNITGKTFAVFRVDPIHSLVSFVSMIDPSPDWFLGVSGLDLCLRNCTWAESKIVDLYPYDAGTDSGPTYTSPDQPTNQRDNIRRIRADNPNDPRSPFYDNSGTNMKPLARLYLSRQRLYEKDCPDGTDNKSNYSQLGSPDPCAVGDWIDKPCNANCGRGMKKQQRAYLDDSLATQAGCSIQLTRRVECYSRCEENSEETPNTTDPACVLTDYSDWSECITTSGSGCGSGTRRKTRTYKNRNAKRCRDLTNPEPLYVEEQCFKECSGSEDKDDEGSCEASDWEESDCEPCGGGAAEIIKKRTRISGRCNENDLVEKENCTPVRCPIKDYCYEDPVSEEDGCRNTATTATNQWYYNESADRCEVFTWYCGNHGNKFSTYKECIEECTGYKLEFQPTRGNNRRNQN